MFAGNASAAELWNQKNEGIIAASEAADYIPAGDSEGTADIELNSVYAIDYDTTKIPFESIAADSTIFVADEDVTIMQGTTISGVFVSSSPIAQFTVSNPVYYDTAVQGTNGLWTVTKNPAVTDSDGRFEISMTYGVEGAVALQLDIVTESGAKNPLR